MDSSGAVVDPWHYPRPQLADDYLRLFQLGLVSARGVFAKRRMGKSEFLEQDLIPAAQAKDYLTAYVNLWDARAQPTAALVAVLGRAVAPKGLVKLLAQLKTPVKKVKASAKFPGLADAGIEAELADKDAVLGPALSELLRGFNQPRKKLLLVLDEAQVLVEPAHTELAHSLRAGLDSRKANIKVVFAGSSEPTLRRMFGEQRQPFYNWAALEPFELLGEAFVLALVARVNAISRHPLAKKDALAAFEALQRTPEFFRRYLTRFLTHFEHGSQGALDDTLAHVFADANFINVWKALLPADQEVLKLLAHGVSDLHAESTRLRLGQALGLQSAVTKNTPAQSLRRLLAGELVGKTSYASYQVQDDAFATWLRNCELDG